MLLNLDAGEDEREPAELWALADVLAVACGGHAGDVASMTRLASFCAGRARPQLGAHPSYPDRDGFGRRTIAIAPAALAASIEQQCRALHAIAEEHGLVLGWVKPHGALYHDAARDPVLAAAVLDGAVAALGHVTVIGPPAGALQEAAIERGLGYLREGFADRATRRDGSLIPRTEPGALITDPSLAAARARELVTAGAVDTICVHADTPDSLAVAHAVRDALRS